MVPATQATGIEAFKEDFYAKYEPGDFLGE